MNIYLEQLIELVDIDKSIDAFGSRVEQVRSALDSKLQEQQSFRDKIEAHTVTVQEHELNIRKNELHLAELIEKLDSVSSKGATVKTEKEIKALQLEEEIAKEQIDFANEEIARFEKVIILKNEEMETFLSDIDAMQSDIDELEKDTQRELELIEKEKIGRFDDKQRLMSQMSQNIIVFYEKIRRWAGNTTIVPVKKQACYGCYMRINDHTYANVIKSEEITTCPHCGRILYMEPHIEEEETAES